MVMKLWLLRPVDVLPDSDNPWSPWYDKVFGFVVRAETEDTARLIAHEHSGNETGHYGKVFDPWLSEKYSTCVELSPDGNQEMIICDFRSA